MIHLVGSKVRWAALSNQIGDASFNPSARSVGLQWTRCALFVTRLAERGQSGSEGLYGISSFKIVTIYRESNLSLAVLGIGHRARSETQRNS